MIDLKEFGEAMLIARQIKGMTKDEVAKAIGTNRSNIGRYERGGALASITMIRKFEELYGMDIIRVVKRKINITYEETNK